MLRFKIHIVSILTAVAVCVFLQDSSGQGLGKNLSESQFGQNQILRYAPITGIFTTEYLRDSSYVYQSSEADSVWMLSAKYCYQYDHQGRVIQSLYADYMQDTWLNRTRLSNTYSEDQLLESQEEQAWNASTREWQRLQQRLYAYNPLGLESFVVTRKWQDQMYRLSSRTEYSYTVGNKLSTEIMYTRNPEKNSWEKVERYNYTYTDDEQLKLEVYQLWNDSLMTWVNEESQEYFYDDENNLIATTTSDWNPYKKSWIDLSIVNISYNDKGQIASSHQNQYSPNSESTVPVESQNSSYDTNGNMGQVVNSYWDQEAQSWQSYEKQKHYWSKHLNGNLSQSSDVIDCTFANPYIIGLPWYCESLKVDVQYTIEVFDQLGRLYYSDRFMGNSTFRISKQLPEGFYLVVIRGGLDYHTEKILVRN